MLHVLAGPGKAYLNEPARLKYLLAPVVCRNAAEQERFYEVVDRFLVEREAVSVEEEVKRNWKKTVFWWTALVVGLLGIGVFLIWFLGGEKKELPILKMEHPFEIAVGDTLLLRNASENLDNQQYRAYWELYGYDTAGRETLLAADSAGGDWAVPVDTIGEIPALWAHLKAIPLKKGNTLAIDRRIRVNCAAMPPEVQIIAPGTAEPEQQLRFSFSGDMDANLRYRWVFEGKDTLEAATAQRAFPEAGSQTVALLIDRPGAAGYCQREIYHNIQIGQEMVRLEPMPLLKAPQEPHWTFAIGTWLLLGLLGLALLLAWLKWLTRKSPITNDQSLITNDQSPRFSTSDRAPYFIPFRSRNALIRPSRGPLRLADVLRQRQEGLRLEVDVPASVRATIARGGFPALRERYNTQPTDYLFLVDEQSPASHQARLFQYLVEILREQDIHMEVFFFKGEPGRVWNADFPGGLALEQLQRLYPQHRLVVMGEGHGMLDPQAIGQHQIRTGLMASFRSWKQCILLTPSPPRNWGFQEAALQRQFVLFPADLQGMTQAAGYLEAGLDAGDLPLTFKAWKEQLEAPRRDPDPQFRRWRTAAEHRDYLKDRQDLFRWLCATAVYPKPTWEMTIAIGHALGMRLSYDDLLVLSRISWLQDGNLHPRLREELLASVSPADERLAREAVRAELVAVAGLASRGAINQELQVNIAIQDFALEPENPEFQDTIRQLLDAGLLSRRQEAELDEVVRKKQTVIQNNIGSKYPEEKAPGIRDYLQPPSTINDKRSTPFLALALTALWLLLFAGIWTMINQNTLEKWFPPTEEGRHFVFFKESFYIDSAVIYNNQGVDTFYADPAQGLRAAAYFEKAAGLPVADTNLLKLYYNLALYQYDSLIQSPTNHQSPITLFRKALPLTYGLHGLGLAHFYQENRDSALFYFERLVAQTDSLFFDTTSVFPNLETLLFPDRPSEIRDVKITETQGGGGLEVWATYYHNVRLNPELRLEAVPLLPGGGIPKGFSSAEILLLSGAGEVSFTIFSPSDSTQLPIETNSIQLRMKSRMGEVVEEKVVKYHYEWKKVKNMESVRAITKQIEQKEDSIGLGEILNRKISIDNEGKVGLSLSVNKDSVVFQKEEKIESPLEGYFSQRFRDIESDRNANTVIWYVHPDGKGNGTSWKRASSDLTSILKNAQFGDEVWVAGGTYTPTNNGDRNVSFILKNGVRVYGGFSGSETARNQRDWDKNPCVLSGEIGKEGIEDNSYNIIVSKNVGPQTILDGFIISGGNANGQVRRGQRTRGGGGWLDLANEGGFSMPLISNCTFIGNRALEGGAFYGNGQNGNCSPSFINCGFVENHAKVDGGAIYFDGRDSSVNHFRLLDCFFKDNLASYGAGIFIANGLNLNALNLDMCSFKNNRAFLWGGGIYYDFPPKGGYFEFQLEDCMFEENYPSDVNKNRFIK